jgi:allantoate deiminase
VRTSSAVAAIRHCRELATYSEEPGFTTRTFLSEPMRDVHRHLESWMTGLGMTVRVDAVGNIRGVHPGATSSAPRLFIGSHLDSVPRAGAFDGVLGVVLGITLVEQLNGDRLPFAIEVVGFSEEEGVRFGVPFIGSRAFVGTADAELLATRDVGGVRVSDAIRAFGLDPAGVSDAAAGAGAVGYLEFHIEQGPVLERRGVPLGIVDAIVGLTRVEVTFTGAAGHAGTTPMNTRRDALAGAAEWIGSVEREAIATPGLVATVGRIEASPGAANVIAGSCTCMLDVRHGADTERIGAVARLASQARDLAARRNLELGWTSRLEQAAVVMDVDLVSALERAVGRSGAPVHHLTSGAGHDAMIVAARMPAAMLFLRSPGGLSHHPDESVLEEDVAAALDAGSRFLHELARDGQ